ncbi:GPP34 family phosphoprotein [Amycolatopsis sp. FDAARGOS 1241]|uniref:GPP34 family phosphoprotein n=1 Tax=Amycolatopsis sp. FDAARGOS 1241 TaxID=2778070 RepID=UPI00194FFA50|nr:GPP34 family phosphoprotein [Amycolatopsis sp. FDAARGOS 1241]QRP48691.1 GPP34 family phosphoprotein [Amycolatopsis sp. FDAARGOS 1241]
MTLSLPARAYLLACDSGKGRVRDRRRTALLVRAAAITDLLLRGRAEESGGRVAVTGLGPTGDLLLDDVLADLAERGAAGWRALLRRDGGDTLRSLELQLAASGVLQQAVTSVLRRKVLQPAEARLAEQARASVAHALHAPLSEVDAADAALTALAAAAGVGISRAEAGRTSARLAEPAEAGGAAGPPLRRAVRQLRARRAAPASGGS